MSIYVNETNPIIEGYHDTKRELFNFDELNKKDDIKLERLRMVTDSGLPFYDIAYIHLIVNGKHVDVTYTFPTDQLDRRYYKRELYNICKKKGILIKGLFDNISILR